MSGEDRPFLCIHQLLLCHLGRRRALSRIERQKRVPFARQAQLERLLAFGAQIAETKSACRDAEADGDRVVEVDEGIDGTQRTLFFQQPLVQRLVGLREFLG